MTTSQPAAPATSAPSPSPPLPREAMALLSGQLARVLGVPDDRVDPDLPLTALGLEPLTACRLRHGLREEAGVEVSLRRLLGGGSVRSIGAQIRNAGPFGGTPPTGPVHSSVAVGADCLRRLAVHAGRAGLSLPDALFAAAVLAVGRWTCGTGTVEVRATVRDAEAPTVRVPLPDLLRWSHFAVYATGLRTSCPDLSAALDPSGARGGLLFRSPSPGEGTAGEDGTADEGSRALLPLHHRWEYADDGRATVRWEHGRSSSSPAGPRDGAGEQISGLRAAYAALLRVLADDTDAWHRVDLGWDPTFAFQEPLEVQPFPRAGLLLDGPLRAAARRSPEAPALLDARGGLSHGALAAAASDIAARLAAAGVRPGGPVAVALPKGFDQICAVTGTSALGAVYIPVDVSWPAARIAAVCRRAEVTHALVPEREAPEFPGSVTLLELPRHLGSSWDEHTGASVADDPAVDPDSPAYVIFTSGSTGEPKGVVVDHAAARVTVDDITDRLDIGPGDRVLGLSALSFDLSVYDIFGVLGAGGALVLPDGAGERDPQHWMDLVEQHGVTLWNTAPALMQMLLDLADADPDAASRQLASLRCVLLSGDWIPVTLPDRLRALVPGVRVISAGGATEAAIWSICHPVGTVPPHWRSIPYGRPLRAQSFHILDDEGRPQPVGRAGELHIAGRGLARGYAGDAAQTAARFPSHEVLGERVYRTGDLGAWRTDGTIEFLGRKDRQVKVRGHRIELGEIESVLDRHPAVRRAVASVSEGADGRRRLLAHVALAPEHVSREAESVRSDLMRALGDAVPAYMVPHHLVLTDALPVTANGKVDHARLAALIDLPNG